jgi:hypothetical protein
MTPKRPQFPLSSVAPAEQEPQNDTFCRSMHRYEDHARHGCNNWSGSASGRSGSDRALASGGICSSNSNSNLLDSSFWSHENIFWKNEAKFCPSLLTILKNEPKSNPNQAKISPMNSETSPLKTFNLQRSP